MDGIWIVIGGVAIFFVLVELYFLTARFFPKLPLWGTRFHRFMQRIGPRES